MARIRRELFKGMSRAIAVRSASKRICGRTIRVPLLYGLGSDHLGPAKSYWPLLFMQRVVKRWPGTVVDIGANVGLYLVYLKATHPKCPYVGFEPNPACHYYLHELLVLNDFDPAIVFPLALSERREIRRLYIRGHGDKMGSFDPDHRWEIDRPRSVDLLAERGDKILEQSATEPVVFIKIDVEGSEKEVLHGLENTLLAQQPIVVCEVTAEGRTSAATKQRRHRIEQIFCLLKRARYECLTVSPEGKVQDCASPDDIDATQHIDRLFVPAISRDEVALILKDVLE